MTIMFTKPEPAIPSGLLCSACKEVKPRDQFYPNARNPSGFSYKCRQCATAYSVAYARKYGAKAKSVGKRFGLTDEQQTAFAEYHERTGMSVTSTIRMALDEFLSKQGNSNPEQELTAHQQQKAETEAA
ncbi:hypothetical protein [Paraburkholderia sp. D1E]|uniref:hypothetical protein n=1 Tax=Paraburkholderia sp. D1E TaxID=3461398 RepID=UPI00404568F7